MSKLTSPTCMIFIPCYKRPEYTKLCLDSVLESQNWNVRSFEYERELEGQKCFGFYLTDDGSNDGTIDLLYDFQSRMHKLANVQVVVEQHKESIGLRNCLIEFIEFVNRARPTFGKSWWEYISKLDNDCVVPKNWINDVLEVFKKSDADILSPNVVPSNAAETYGKDIGLPYMPSETVGGLWTMKKSMIEGVQFDKIPVGGITGAFNLLAQIILEKEPKIGWLKDVVVQDIGHWSGTHPQHIKSSEHFEYSVEVGRKVGWA